MLQKTFIQMHDPLNNFAPLSSDTQAGFPAARMRSFSVCGVEYPSSNFELFSWVRSRVHSRLNTREKELFFTPDLERIEF